MRLTEAELATLNGLWRERGFKSRSAYIRAAILDERSPRARRSTSRPDGPEISPQVVGLLQGLRYELRKIGTNLNQIAYVANSKKQVKLREVLVDVLARIEGRLDALADLWKALEQYRDEAADWVPPAAREGASVGEG